MSGALTKEAILKLRVEGFSTAEASARGLVSAVDRATRSTTATAAAATAAGKAFDRARESATRFGATGTAAGIAMKGAFAASSGALEALRNYSTRVRLGGPEDTTATSTGPPRPGAWRGASAPRSPTLTPASVPVNLGGAVGAAGAVAGVGAAGSALFSAMGRGEKIRDLESAFKSLTQPIGGSEAAMTALKKATGGAVDEQTLMLASNKLLIADLGLSRDQIAKLASTAVIMSKVMGTDAATAVADLAEGLQKQSPMILDNLGITVRSEEALHEYAKAHHMAVSDIDGHTKKTLFLAEAMKGLDAARAKVGPGITATATATGALTTRLTTLGNEIDKVISKQEGFAQLFNAITAGAEKAAASGGPLQRLIAMLGTAASINAEAIGNLGKGGGVEKTARHALAGLTFGGSLFAEAIAQRIADAILGWLGYPTSKSAPAPKPGGSPMAANSHGGP